MPFAIPILVALQQLAARARGLPFEDRFLELLARAGELERQPPDALVHGEINTANARRRDDGSVVLIDWDQAGCAPAAMEYGYPLITVFLSEGEHAFDDPSACSFIRGYVEAGRVVDARQMFNGALFHALRYMWWGSTERRCGAHPGCRQPGGGALCRPSVRGGGDPFKAERAVQRHTEHRGRRR
jgi:pentatricopeptide repeat protein